MFNNQKPTEGNLLISEPFMLDPTFERSVIMLCEHTEEGSVGLVLNHRSHLLLSDIFGEIKSEEFPLYLGGPVNNSALYFLHKMNDILPGGINIYEDIYWGGDFEKLIYLINENLINPNDVKFFLGYSGWSPNQLNDELNQNSWAVHKTFPAELVFLLDGEDLWKQALINLGPKYAHVANFPKSPHLN